MMRLGVKVPNCVDVLQFEVALHITLLPAQPPAIMSCNATFFIYLEYMGGDRFQPTRQTSFVCLEKKSSLAELQRYLGVSVHVNIPNYAADERRQMPEDSRGQGQRGHL